MPLVAGQTLSFYEILGPLGAGAMGEVYRARDTRLDREVALKVLPEALAEHPDALSRFRREARALAALDHPNIVPIYSVEDADGKTFLTMGLVEGTTLGSAVPKGGLGAPELLELALPIVDGVAAAHERGIVHRDLKPDNVMIGSDRRVRVLDFGLARILEDATSPTGAGSSIDATVEGRILGTVPYMSPEQVEGRPADERSDVFSLGILLYEMASGVRPFGGDSHASIMSAILRDTPRPLGEVGAHLSSGITPIIERCLEKRPEARYASAGELREALRDLHPAGPAARGSARRTLAGAALLMVTFAIVFQLTRDDASRGSTDPFSRPAVAVMPFVDATADGSAEYLAFGLTDEVIVGLMHSKALPVIARGATEGVGADGRSASDVAKELGASYLVEARITKVSPRLLMTVNLTDADGKAIWAEQFDREEGVDEALDVAEELVGRVLGAVRGSEFERVDRGERPPADAWEHYIQALVIAGDWRPELHAKAREHVDKALEIAPRMAAAWWVLGELEICRHMSEPYDPQTAPAELQEIIGHFRQAHEISPFHAAACGCLGYLLLATGEAEAARVVFEEAYEANPFSVDLHVDYGIFLLHQGEYERARQMVKRGLRLDPVSGDRSVLYMLRAIASLADGNRDAASADVERSLFIAKTIYVSPAGVPLRYALNSRGSAASLMEEIRELYPDFSPANPVFNVILKPIDDVFRAAPGEYPESVDAVFRELEH